MQESAHDLLPHPPHAESHSSALTDGCESAFPPSLLLVLAVFSSSTFSSASLQSLLPLTSLGLDYGFLLPLFAGWDWALLLPHSLVKYLDVLIGKLYSKG